MPYKDKEVARLKGNERQRKYRNKNKEVCLERTIAWKEANPERVRENDRNAYKRLRERALTQYGNKCGKCGLADPRVLQVDHVYGGGNKEHTMLRNSGVYRRALKFPQEYQCLCANCNWIKRAERNENVPRKDVELCSDSCSTSSA